MFQYSFLFSSFTLQKFRLAAKRCVVSLKCKSYRSIECLVSQGTALGLCWELPALLPLPGNALGQQRLPETAFGSHFSPHCSTQRGAPPWFKCSEQSTTHYSSVLTNRFCIGRSLLLPSFGSWEQLLEQPRACLRSCYSDVMSGASHWGEPQTTVLLGSPELSLVAAWPLTYAECMFSVHA